MKKYYSMETSGKETDLYIFGNITGYPWKEKDTDAYGIVKAIQGVTSNKINVHINSYGGDVSEGLAIYNTLKNSKAKVTTYCDGFACSAASVIFMAGDERIMNSASLLMIHNAWSSGYGNANELRKQAEDLDKITQASRSAYMAHVNISEGELIQLMDDETWLTAEESLKQGFATSIVEQEEERINQSAMMSIREKVLSTPEKVNCAKATVDASKIAEEIYEKLSPLFEKEKQNKKQEVGTGFGAFLNSKKEKNQNEN